LIRNADKKIRAVSHYFYEDLWDYLYFPLDNFLSAKNGELEFIILNKVEKDDKIIDLKERYPDKVKVYNFGRKDVLKEMPEFVTIDDCGYRYGLSDKARKGKMITGVINFGDREVTASFNSLFELLKDNSKEEDLSRFYKNKEVVMV
jgi:hypothetical protein